MYFNKLLCPLICPLVLHRLDRLLGVAQHDQQREDALVLPLEVLLDLQVEVDEEGLKLFVHISLIHT